MLWTALFASLAAPAFAGDVTVRVQDKAGKPVEGVVVYLADVAVSSAAADAVMGQRELEFSPHVLAVQAGTKVKFVSKDPVQHEIYSFSKAKRFELPLAKAGEERPPVEFDQPGVVKLGCNIHDWMQGYVVVLGTPHFAMTGADGAARLPALPDGKRRLALWSERVKGGDVPPRDVAVKPGTQAVTLAIDAGKPISPRPRAAYPH